MAEDLTFTEQEQEFLTAFVRILEHLKNRAIKAEREVSSMRKELTALREQVEYLGTGSVSASGLGQCNTPSPARELSDGQLEA